MTMENLLVSFSGGETSAFMAYWLWTHKRDQYNMVFVMANTGQENWETIVFARNCSIHFGFKLHIVEALIDPENRKGTKFKEINWEENIQSISTDGEPFEDMIKKYGIPNQATPHCTRELKQRPIEAFCKKYFNGQPYLRAIGIRIDEIDRMNAKKEKIGIIYPLIYDIPMTKPKINFWWSQQSFRLELKGYQGNCITCWKKSDKKLYQIAIDSEDYAFNFFGEMEAKYGTFIPESRLEIMKKTDKLEAVVLPITFFRKNRSAIQICQESKTFDGTVSDDSQDFDLHNDACEVYSECADN